jgi:uncharacterized membrane-anchored protein
MDSLFHMVVFLIGAVVGAAAMYIGYPFITK